MIQKHPQVGHTKMKKTSKCTKMNVNNLLLHHDKRMTTPTMKKAKNKNRMKKKFTKNQAKAFMSSSKNC